MKSRMNKILALQMTILFVVSSCKSALPEYTNKYNQATPTETQTVLTEIPTVAPLPSPSSTHKPILPTKTPKGYIPQVYIGINESDVQVGACGDRKTLWTMNYGEEGEEISFWDYYSDYPKPIIGETRVIYGTRDWRGNMDVCVYPGRPIIAQHHGIVLENRVHLFTSEEQECILSIDLSLDGLPGYELILAHFDPDLDPDKEGIQGIKGGTIIEPGTLLGYTHQYSYKGIIRNPVLNIGLFNSNSNETTNFGYWFYQDLSLIGTDGQINLVRSQ